MEHKILEVNNLESGYDKIKVLKGVSFYLNHEEKIGIFGPNGHGKTTLLKTISGLIPSWSGEILFNGENISNTSPSDKVERGIIQVPQGNILFPQMTVLDALNLGAYSKRASKNITESLGLVFKIFPWLLERKNQICMTLSGGQRQMLSIAIGLMGRAKLLMVDEPTLGLSPKIKSELKENINNVAKMGIPFILVEQDIEFLMEFTDRMYLLEKGRIVAEVDKYNLLDHKSILDIYFGDSDLKIK